MRASRALPHVRLSPDIVYLFMLLAGRAAGITADRWRGAASHQHMRDAQLLQEAQTGKAAYVQACVR